MQRIFILLISIFMLASCADKKSTSSVKPIKKNYSFSGDVKKNTKNGKNQYGISLINGVHNSKCIDDCKKCPRANCKARKQDFVCTGDCKTCAKENCKNRKVKYDPKAPKPAKIKPHTCTCGAN